MYALTAVFPNGKAKLLGFVNSQKEIDEAIGSLCSKYGTEALAATGVQFNAELAA